MSSEIRVLNVSNCRYLEVNVGKNLCRAKSFTTMTNLRELAKILGLINGNKVSVNFVAV